MRASRQAGSLAASGSGGVRGAFRHEALLYEGEEEFTARVGDFVREGVEAGDSVLVVVSGQKVRRLRAELGSLARNVEFEDMDEVGVNPARIIPLWHAFAAGSPPQTALRGVGEPIDANREPDVLVECERHEALLNVAFGDDRPFHLLCPYDTKTLPRAVLDEAARNHPYVRNGGIQESATFRGVAACAAPQRDALGAPPADTSEAEFDLASLRGARTSVSQLMFENGFGARQTENFVLVVHELATNAVRHGGGGGTLALWADGDTVFAEVRDAGRIDDPLVGRVEPPLGAARGRGVWIANQLCDLVQIRSRPDGNVARARLRRR